LKLGNIVLKSDPNNPDKKILKLINFSLSGKCDNGDKLNDVCGTPNYIAPKIINNKKYDYSVDIWSLDIILYTLLIGKRRFEMSSVSETYKKSGIAYMNGPMPKM
jgi:polo-like kinase 1